jgi:hypothetical protein
MEHIRIAVKQGEQRTLLGAAEVTITSAAAAAGFACGGC